MCETNCVVQKHSLIEKSDKIGSLAMALAKAQGEIKVVNKDEAGYGYKYANLASTIEESQKILSKNNLAVSQFITDIDGDGMLGVVTMLMYGDKTEGEYLMAETRFKLVEMKGCNSAQMAGATASYARRYALQAILNMATEDNDASSSGFKKGDDGDKPKATPTPIKKGGFGQRKKD